MKSDNSSPATKVNSLPAETGLTGDIEVIFSGAINDVVVFSDKETKKVLRHRTREEFSVYEKEFFKEPLIAAVLAAARENDAAFNESVLDAAVKALLTTRKGGESHTVPLPKTLSYDHSRELLPSLWMIQEYVQGPLLIDAADNQKWYKLGALVGRLHTIQFEKSGRLDNRTQTSEQRLQVIVDDIRKASPVPLTYVWDIPALAQGKMSLCHGDVHGRNVIAADELTLLDWDNAVIDFPELDLVKPLHWTTSDADGFFIPHDAYYAAYLRGHEDAYGAPPNRERMKLYELSWLIRSYRFEERREASGRIPAPPNPPAQSYLARIKALANGE